MCDSFGCASTAKYGWTNYLFKDRFYGVCVPEFRFVSESEGTFMEIPADHGQKLRQCLENTVGNGAYVTLVEGFTDWEENAALWRAKDGAYEETHHDYPSQRLNILRQFSRDPFPQTQRLEAEACDFYYDLTPGNSGGAYRDGELDIDYYLSANGMSNWVVLATDATEWLRWCEIPLHANSSIRIRAAVGAPTAAITLNITGPTNEISRAFDLPSTGGANEWATIDLGELLLEGQAYYNITLVFGAGGPRIDYLEISGE
jgi:hypothetical protein